jgi:hypothetical protein
MDVDIPHYGNQGTSPLTQALTNSGFSGWLKLSSHSQNAFYKLLALGLTYHFNQSSLAEFKNLDLVWQKNARNVRNVWYQYQGQERALENPEFLRALGNALIEDLRPQIGPESPMPKSWFSEIAAGKAIDKNLTEQYLSFLGPLNIALICYEWTVSGQLLPAKYISADSNKPQVYVTLASEADAYYLLFHSTYSRKGYKLGYPYYTKGEVGDIPSVTAAARATSTEANQTCIQQEGEIIQLLASLLAKYGPQQLPPEAQPQQIRLKELIGSVTSLVRTCGCTLQLDTPEIARLTHIPDVPVVDTQPVKPHDCTNCESYPEAGQMLSQLGLNHVGEYFHYQCLYNYICALPDPVKSVPCPRCGKELSESTVEAVAPWVTEERRRQKNQAYTAVAIASQGTNCPNCLRTYVGAGFNYACGVIVCLSCAVRTSANTCPFCQAFLTEDESRRITIEYSRTYR